MDPVILLIIFSACVVFAGWFFSQAFSKNRSGAEKMLAVILAALVCVGFYATITTTNPEVYRTLYGREMPNSK